MGEVANPLTLYTYLYSVGYIIKMVAQNQCGSGTRNCVRFSFHGWNDEEQTLGLLAALRAFFVKMKLLKD